MWKHEFKMWVNNRVLAAALPVWYRHKQGHPHSDFSYTKLKAEWCAHITSVTKTGTPEGLPGKNICAKVSTFPIHHSSRKTDAFSWNLNQFKKPQIVVGKHGLDVKSPGEMCSNLVFWTHHCRDPKERLTCSRWQDHGTSFITDDLRREVKPLGEL